MEKVWLASYPKGVPELIPDPPYSSLTDMMNACMKKYASRNYVREPRCFSTLLETPWNLQKSI